MNSHYKNKRKPSPSTEAKRRKLKHTSLDQVCKLLECDKGGAIQALHMVFDCGSFSFETNKHVVLPGTFISFLNLEGYSFIGYGGNKIASRASCCKAALIFLLEGLSTTNSFTCDPLKQQLCNNEDDSNTLPDTIASIVLSKYKRLRDDSKQSIPWFKIIASIVLVRNDDVKNAEVVALSTGSKCIEPKNVRLDGSVIVDSHAEILIRRCFQYFLYSQMLSTNSEERILEYHDSKYRVKPGIRFYLFINSAPCGDARIFTVSDKDKSYDKHPNRTSRGVLRIKLDGGNSTVPLSNFEKYDPKRLMVMSCSDKLLKMNALGLQGSLLSNIIEPIYLDGIIVGDSFQKSHITRALFERAEDVILPLPFKIHYPLVHGPSKGSEIVTKSPKTSINWIYGYSPEIINSTTGKTMLGGPSRLCKQNLFRRYIQIQNYPKTDYFYEKYKNECKQYLVAKKCFYDFLEKKRLGKWIRRKPSFDNFVVNG